MERKKKQEPPFVKKKNSSHVEINTFTLHVSATVALFCLQMPWQASNTDVYLQLRYELPCLELRHCNLSETLVGPPSVKIHYATSIYLFI